MRKLLNTLYILQPTAYLSRDGQNIVVKVDGKEIARRPIHILESIVCFNYLGISPGLMQLCTEHNVNLSFLTPTGRFIGRIQGKVSGNVLLRRTQYRVADDEDQSLKIAKNMILGKIVNQRKIIDRGIRDHGDVVDTPLLNSIKGRLSDIISRIECVASANELRGLEGEASRYYFSGLNELILRQKDIFFLKERTRRPPKDCFNALLSFAYTLLTSDMTHALETVGLDPYVGFLHTDRPGRESLSLDMIEELRGYIADRFVLSVINRHQITKNDFIYKESGSVILSEKGRKKFISAWQKRKLDVIEHPFIKERIEIGLLPYVQAMLLSRLLRNDIDDYPPFFM